MQAGGAGWGRGVGAGVAAWQSLMGTRFVCDGTKHHPQYVKY